MTPAERHPRLRLALCPACRAAWLRPGERCLLCADPAYAAQLRETDARAREAAPHLGQPGSDQ